jgi:hypothetical protein
MWNFRNIRKIFPAWGLFTTEEVEKQKNVHLELSNNCAIEH